MKTGFFLPFVLLLGLAIGGWGPKEELRATRREIDTLRKTLADRDKEDRSDVFTSMVKIPGRASQAADKAKRPRIFRREPQEAPESATSAVSNEASVVKGQPPPPPDKAEKQAPMKPEDLRARIDEAKELWKARAEIARAQWIDRLKLTPDGAALFDEAINNMNERVYTAMQNLADQLATTDTLTPETGMRVFNEMTASMVQTYDDLSAIVPDDMRGEIAATELSDFIDPAVAEPLIAVQDKLDKIPRQRNNRLRLFK